MGCKTDKDCGGGRTCKQVSITSSYSMGICEDWCTTDSQCSAPEKCIYSNKALPAKTCGQPCTLDLQCKTHEICKDKKFCDAKAINCKSNPDCTQVPWLDVCDVKSGMCGCSSTKICEKAITLIGGNPKCVYISF